MERISSITYRKQQLSALKSAIEAQESAIIAALAVDFQKPQFEAVVTETAYVLSTIQHTLNHLKRWGRPKRVWPSLLNFPSVDTIHYEPYGRVLIIAPWNYPFQLAMAPLVAAIAAGNKVVLKPSELTPTVASCIKKIIAAVFTPEEVTVVEGGIETSQHLLQQRWDYIFFTGSVAVGKIVAQAAAVHMTPYTLELGGKSPAIVTADAPLARTARRIVWGKFMNAGQTCIAPDYLLVHASIYSQFVEVLIQEIQKAYGTNPMASPDFARIINTRNWERLHAYLKDGELLYGGVSDRESRYIGPTLLGNPSHESGVMQEEIFGPILPILTYTDVDTLDQWINSFEKPLALYVFSASKSAAKTLFKRYAFGGGCINDTLLHFNNERLPFGGVGHSGVGSYHGRWGFETFSHRKSCVYKPFWLDIPIRYAPYKNKVNFVKKIMKLF